MAAPEAKDVPKTGFVFDLSAAALRKVIANPLSLRKPLKPTTELAFNTCASQDPVCAVLENDILPRLIQAHVVEGTVVPRQERVEIDNLDTQNFVPLSLNMEAQDLLGEVDRFLDQGVSVEQVYLDLLVPAARYLGELWKSDECDFVDVTMGLWRLQEVMREISRRSPPQRDPIGQARTALFCPIPGDVHSFGAQMIEDVFARAGWQSEVILKPERRELLDCVSRRPLDLIGLTVSRNSPISALAGLVKAIRSVALKPNLCVMVGGQMINDNPALVKEIGADGTGVDAKAAIETAERLVPAEMAWARSLT